MTGEIASEVLSSHSRLKIADLLSTRPRTLGELAEQTGVSVQAVLKHLEKLDALGLVQKKNIKGKEVSVRRLYEIKGAHIGDFSNGDLTLVSMTWGRPAGASSQNPLSDIESLAEDAIVQRRRINDQTRKLSRMIGDLVNDEGRLGALIEQLPLTDEEKLIVRTAFTEETLGDAENVLARVHGMPAPRRSIERALAKARRNVKK